MSRGKSLVTRHYFCFLVIRICFEFRILRHGSGQVSCFEFFVLGIPSTEFILSADEGLRTCFAPDIVFPMFSLIQIFKYVWLEFIFMRLVFVLQV